MPKRTFEEYVRSRPEYEILGPNPFRRVNWESEITSTSSPSTSTATTPAAKKNPKDVPPVRHSYKTKVEKIVGHDTANKTGVRFATKWQDWPVVDDERSPFLIEMGAKPLLKKYLLKVANGNSKRFNHMIKRQPDLIDIIKE